MLLWALGAGVTAYDPQADAWTILSTEPIGTPGSPMFNSAGVSAVWTGSELVVADAGSAGTAAFDRHLGHVAPAPRPPGVSSACSRWSGPVGSSAAATAEGRRGWRPSETAWHQPTEPTPEHAGSVPAAQVWVGDRFLELVRRPLRQLDRGHNPRSPTPPSRST